MIRRPPRSTQSRSSAASDVYKRQAGEHLVRYALIDNDGRQAGRTGPGAVMGSKKLKAIALRGSHPITVADMSGLLAETLKIVEISQGPGTAKYRTLGTPSN